MLELLALVGLFIVGLAVFVLLPLSLAWFLLKLVLVCCLALLALALAPVLLAVLLVVLPAMALCGLVGLGWAVAAA